MTEADVIPEGIVRIMVNLLNEMLLLLHYSLASRFGALPGFGNMLQEASVLTNERMA